MVHHSLYHEFGFKSADQFLTSLIRPNLLNISIPFAAIGSMIECIFGLKWTVVVAFVFLLTLELVSGIFASYIEGQKITSKRMKAFLMMLFVWLVVLFILNAFRSAFVESDEMHVVFEYLFNGVLLFVNVIYFKSIWENAGRIMNKKDEFKKLISIFNSKQVSKDENMG